MYLSSHLAVIVGCCIAFILIVALSVCFVVFLYKSVFKTSPTQYANGGKQVHKRKKPK